MDTRAYQGGFSAGNKKFSISRTRIAKPPSKRYSSQRGLENQKENKMFKTGKAVLVVTATLAIVSTLFTSPAQALGTPKVQQVVTWGWEDGADRSHRDFSEEDYDTAAEMPQLQVTVTPTNVGRRVVLESLDDMTRTWLQVAYSSTNAAGIAKLSVDPSCDETGFWCDHDTTYRIRVLKSGTQKLIVSRPFTISYTAITAATM